MITRILSASVLVVGFFGAVGAVIKTFGGSPEAILSRFIYLEGAVMLFLLTFIYVPLILLSFVGTRLIGSKIESDSGNIVINYLGNFVYLQMKLVDRVGVWVMLLIWGIFGYGSAFGGYLAWNYSPEKSTLFLLIYPAEIVRIVGMITILFFLIVLIVIVVRESFFHPKASI